MEGTAVAEGAGAPDRVEHLVCVGIVHCAGPQLAPVGVGHGDAAVVQAVHKIHGGVDGIDDEQMLGVQIVPLFALLTVKFGARHGGAQPLRQQRLDLPVILRDHVPAAGFALGHRPVGVQHQLGRFPLGFHDCGADRLRMCCVHLAFLAFSAAPSGGSFFSAIINDTPCFRKPRRRFLTGGD